VSPIPDFTQYVPPGVYVEDVTTPIVASAGLVDATVAIVALSQGFQRAVETVGLSSATPTSLSNLNVSTSPAPVVALQTGVVLTSGVDYTISSATDTISGATTTTLTRLPADVSITSPGGAVEGASVTVTYQYVDPSYYLPRLFSDFDLLSSAYGVPLSSSSSTSDENTQVLSPLTLAAKIALENGANSVLALAVNPADGVVGNNPTDLKKAFATAYAKLSTDYRVSVLVPIFPVSVASDIAAYNSMIADVKAHVVAASADGHGRISILGASSLLNDTNLAYQTVSAAVNNKRVAVVYPTRFTYYNSSANQSILISGAYAAAALGGIAVYNPVQRSLTKVGLSSFSGIPASVAQKQTTAFKNGLSSKGVMVIQDTPSGRLECRHGVSTDMSSLTTRELSLTRIADTLLKSMQQGLDNAGMIGDPITSDTPTRVKGIMVGLLEQLTSTGTINAYGSVVVRQQALPTGDPSVIQCKFAYQPAVPLNYITVQFAIDLSSGFVTSSDNTSTPTTG
jgi:hypothetical protein